MALTQRRKTLLVIGLVVLGLGLAGVGIWHLSRQGYQQEVSGRLEQGWSLWLYVPVFLVGLLTSFTPCVYPVIPITVGYIGARAGEHRLHGFILSLFYVIGLSLVYALLGMVVGATGSQFGALQNNAWVLLAVANIMVLMGASMMGAFEIPLPRFLQQNKASAVKGRGGILGALLVGMVSGLVVGPCTAPVLAVMLAMVASMVEQGSMVVAILKGGSLMFVFAFGMGMLLLVIGTFAGLVKSLPKPGGWMVGIKKAMGVLMFALAAFFLVHLGQNASAELGETFDASRYIPLVTDLLKDELGLFLVVAGFATSAWFVIEAGFMKTETPAPPSRFRSIIRSVMAVLTVLFIELMIIAFAQWSFDLVQTAELLNVGGGASGGTQPSLY